MAKSQRPVVMDKLSFSEWTYNLTEGLMISLEMIIIAFTFKCL